MPKMHNTYPLKKQFNKKLMKQALFSDNIFTQMTALILLLENDDPESGWLLETLLKNKLIFKSGSRS